MDNFKNSKRPSGRHHGVDGFVTPRGTGHVQRRPVDMSFRPQAPAAPVAQFKQPSGFTGGNQPIMPTGDTKAPIGDGPHQSKRKKHPKKPKSTFRKVTRVFAVLLVLAVLCVGGVAGYGFLKARQVFKGGAESAAALEKNVDPVKLKGEGDGRINILMLGVGGEGHDGAYLTDTIIVASIDPVQNEAALLSIPRDLWVKYETGGTGKINAAFSYARDSNFAKTKNFDSATKAGAEATQKILTNVLGIPLNYYVYVDFNGFQKAVDTVGGIEINVTKDLTVSETLWNPATRKNYVLDVREGLQSFDGLKALFYSRSRHTSARGDFDRAERQRAVIIALKEKVQSAGTYANPIKVTQLLSTFGNHVRTDMSINEVMRLYDIGKNITPDKVASLGLADPPNVMVGGDSIDGLSVQVPKAGLFNYSAIQSYVRNSLKDAFIKNENASILVLNGTSTEGMAGNKAAELRSFGYTVAGTGNAPNKNFTKTIIVDMRNGEKKYTKNYLERRFATTATTSLPDPTIVPGTADFVIILGSDAVGTSASQ